MPTDLDRLLAVQAGVVSRRQLGAAGWADHDIARMLRRRLLAKVFEGVYVNHTGDLTWLQQAWAAVLFSWPAALSHSSALRAVDGPGRRDTDELPIHVVVAKDRRLVQPPGVRIRRRRNFEENVQWNLCPPRVRYEHAAIDVATTAATEFATVAALAQSVQLRRTTAGRLLDALNQRDRVPRRHWVEGVLQDIAAGTCSVLEHGYLTRVERPHRLPRAQRQATGTGRTGRVYWDASYEEPLLGELDSRLFHDSAGARDRDFDRDLLAQADGRLTTRLSWGQVFDRPCWTAGQVGVLLQQRGWTGSPTCCGPGCALSG